MLVSRSIEKFLKYSKKWFGNKIPHISKSRSKNEKVKLINGYIIFKEKIDIHNGDYWELGGGANDIQYFLSEFQAQDWQDLKQDISNWNVDYRNILIESVGFGFDGMFSPSLKKESIAAAGNFLLDLFVEDIGDRHEITYFSFFINQSNSNQIEKLIFMRDWMLQNGYDKKEWTASTINPLGNIEEAIRKTDKTNS